VVGDATGADKAVQKYLLNRSYKKVSVFCSGDSCRNNLGNWEPQFVKPSKARTGFQFYAAKDREMALAADFGLMIWDGESPGTVLNVLRLVHAGKKAVLFNAPEEKTLSFKAPTDWETFISHCSLELLESLRNRASAEELVFLETSKQKSFL
jgi:adenine-specific DNA-methyltransferase